MCKLIRFRKNILIKGTAVATVLSLVLVNSSIYAFAEENTDGLHNTLESEEIRDEVKEEVENINSIYILFNNEETKDETIKDEEVRNEEIKDEEVKNEEIKKEEVKDEEVKNEEIKNEEEKNVKDNEKDTVSGNDIEDIGKDTVSGNDIEDIGKDTISGNDLGDIEKEEQEIIDVVVPTTYTLALNPYGLSIKTGEDTISTEQVISGTYGIVNRSSTDQIVSVSLTVEDCNGEELIFVDSAEEAENAGMNVYAIYLAAVPANEEEVLIDGEPVDGNVTGETLQNVEMTGAAEQAITLYAGVNRISFKLSKAVYTSETEEEFIAGDLAYEDDTSESVKNPKNVFKELAPDGMGVTAYTFNGVMNPNAEWEKLHGGIKLSVVYTYQTADGREEIIEGTGAMIPTD